LLLVKGGGFIYIDKESDSANRLRTENDLCLCIHQPLIN
jgi:hypothetical protein